MKKLLLILMIALTSIFISQDSIAQGCVAIRGASACTLHQPDSMQSAWQVSANYRYFKSFRHYREGHEEKERVENGSDVRNYTNFLDLSILRNINARWSLGLSLPISSTRRTSLYEHDGKTRHSTSSFGVGDVRITAYRWMLDPLKQPKGNIQLGLGIKLPTGDYKYQDFFYKSDSLSVLGPVDQSIQLGDGGTGITAEVNAYYNFSKVISVYGNFYYLANPREQNGTSSARGSAPSAANIANRSYVMSVPDQYLLRAGVSARFNQFGASLGVREEALPAKDLIGGSNGFRRPGYIIAIEPGLTYDLKRMNFYAYVPVAVERKRTQSVPDQIRSKLTGVRTVGDAAFADYSINVGVSFRF